MTRALPALVLVAVVGCGTTEQVGDAHLDSATDTSDTIAEIDVIADPVDTTDPVGEDSPGDPTCGEDENGLVVHEPVTLADGYDVRTLDYFIHLFWTGSEYAMAWRPFAASESIYLARLDGEARIVLAPRPIRDFAHDWNVTWNGTEFCSVFRVPLEMVGNALGMQRISLDGETAYPVSPLESERIMGDDHTGLGPSLIWIGDRYLLAWSEYLGSWAGYGHELKAGFVDETGEVLLEEFQIQEYPPGDVLSSFAMQWNGHEAALVWNGWGEFFGVDLEHWSGDAIEISLITPEAPWFTGPSLTGNLSDGSDDPHVAWSGSAFHVFWNRYSTDRETVLTMTTDVPEYGMRFNAALASGNLSAPKVAAAASHFGLAYSSSADGADSLIFGLYEWDGDSLTTPVVIPTSPAVRRYETVWSGSEFGVLWVQDQVDETEILFTRIGFCP